MQFGEGPVCLGDLAMLIWIDTPNSTLLCYCSGQVSVVRSAKVGACWPGLRGSSRPRGGTRRPARTTAASGRATSGSPRSARWPFGGSVASIALASGMAKP
jgi:hypothetical protein